jgi:WD40 repeat protein
MAGCLTLLGHDDSVYDVRWAPDGATVGSASRDGTVALWDVAT